MSLNGLKLVIFYNQGFRTTDPLSIRIKPLSSMHQGQNCPDKSLLLRKISHMIAQLTIFAAIADASCNKASSTWH
jgi:hypothetical protein